MVELLFAALLGPPLPAEPAKRLLRLKVSAGQEFSVNLSVDRDKPTSSGEIREKVRVLSNDRGVISLRCTLVGMTIDRIDRTSELNKMLKKASVTFSWTTQAQRTGEMLGLEMGTLEADLTPLLQEAGLYLCEFPTRAVGVGDSWRGSTTATGGCTSATYTLKSIEQDVGEIEVTNIRFLIPVEPIGPMRMTVDLKSGLPTRVEYRVKGQRTGRVSRYVQTIG